jgi:AcrR family transcriptional regulator
VRVIQRVAPEAPRVTDIVAEAGSSNKAFYRYFTGKDELILAVMERGVAIAASYLEHQMAKETEPSAKIARWISGGLAQVADPHLITLSRAAIGQMSAAANQQVADSEIMLPMRALLTEPVAALGGPDPERDADTVFLCATGTMRRYVGSGHRPDQADVDHLVRFCLRGIGVRA